MPLALDSAPIPRRRHNNEPREVLVERVGRTRHRPHGKERETRIRSMKVKQSGLQLLYQMTMFYSVKTYTCCYDFLLQKPEYIV